MFIRVLEVENSVDKIFSGCTILGNKHVNMKTKNNSESLLDKFIASMNPSSVRRRRDTVFLRGNLIGDGKAAKPYIITYTVKKTAPGSFSVSVRSI